MQISEITVSTKGQIVIPQAMRDAAGILPGTRLSLRLDDNGTLQLEPVRTKTWADLLGILHRPGAKAMSVRDMDEAIMEAVADDDERIMRQYRAAKKKSKRKRAKNT